jgi:hypothetical protein
MAEFDYGRLVKALRTNGELTQGSAAEKLGITPGQLNMLQFCKAKVEAGVVKKAPATAKSVRNLRDRDSDRWEMIAARTGVSVATAKELYREAGGDPAKSYTGRGRNFSNGPSKPKAKAKTSTASKAKARTTKGKSKATASKKGGAIVRRRTRAGSGGNPS